MRYPEYYPHDEPADNLIYTYMEAVADDKVINAYSADEPLIAASMLVKELCVNGADMQRLANQRSYHQTLALLRRASDNSNGTPASNIQPRLTRRIAEMVSSHDQPFSVAKRRHKTHVAAVDGIRQSLDALPDDGLTVASRDKEAIGSLSEYTALGLLTRLNHPRLLALPALPHQDKRQGYNRRSNFDIIVIEGRQPADDPGPDDGETLIHKVQVKAACIGFCDQPILPIRPWRPTAAIGARQHVADAKHIESERNGVLDGYSDDTVLVSGCCDLGHSNRGSKLQTRTGELLVAELDGTASADDIAELDALSNQLLIAITSEDPLRHGHSSSSPQPLRQKISEIGSIAAILSAKRAKLV